MLAAFTIAFDDPETYKNNAEVNKKLVEKQIWKLFLAIPNLIEQLIQIYK